MKKPAKPAKKKPPWHPVTVAAQRAQHRAAVRAAARAARTWKPVPANVQQARHQAAVKRARAPKKRQWSPGYDLACCSAEAVAMSLRLAGVPVTDADVLALYFATADGPDDGAAIEDTLEAASRWGVGGVRLIEHQPLIVTGATGVRGGPLAALGSTAERHREVTAAALAADQHVEDAGGVGLVSASHGLILGPDDFGDAARPDLIEQRAEAGHLRLGTPDAGDLIAAGDQKIVQARGCPAEEAHGLILGLALPEGPHAVLATPDGWWSWGELYDPSEFPGAVIEEAWAVTWS